MRDARRPSYPSLFPYLFPFPFFSFVLRMSSVSVFCLGCGTARSLLFLQSSGYSVFPPPPLKVKVFFRHFSEEVTFFVSFSRLPLPGTFFSPFLPLNRKKTPQKNDPLNEAGHGSYLDRWPLPLFRTFSPFFLSVFFGVVSFFLPAQSSEIAIIMLFPLSYIISPLFWSS